LYANVPPLTAGSRRRWPFSSCSRPPLSCGGKCQRLEAGDPAVSGGTFAYKAFSNRPLFADGGPSIDDIRQGYVGDCYFLATLAAIAKTNANVIRQKCLRSWR